MAETTPSLHGTGYVPGVARDIMRRGTGHPGGMFLAGDILYVGFQNGNLVAWDTENETAQWTWQADASINIRPVVIGENLYVACNSGTVQVLELLDQ